MEKTLVFRKSEEMTLEDVTKQFTKDIEKVASSKKQAEDLAELFAKTPTDKYFVVDKRQFQGDIFIYPEGTPMYNKYIDSWEKTCDSPNMNLQLDKSWTGDHAVHVPNNSKYTLEVGTIKLNDKSTYSRSMPYRVKLLTIDTSFLVYHQEHGNVIVVNDAKKKYLCVPQLDSSDMARMAD